MKFDELHMILREARRLLIEFFDDLSPQVATFNLDMFNFATLARTQLEEVVG